MARLHSTRRVALLHYSPMRETVVGEPEEIFPFLGCDRLEEPLNRYGVSVVFHGHAHRGGPAGKTAAGVPVYNVALPVLKRADPNGLPVKVFELAVGREEDADGSAAAPGPRRKPSPQTTASVRSASGAALRSASRLTADRVTEY